MKGHLVGYLYPKSTGWPTTQTSSTRRARLSCLLHYLDGPLPSPLSTRANSQRISALCLHSRPAFPNPDTGNTFISNWPLSMDYLRPPHVESSSFLFERATRTCRLLQGKKILTSIGCESLFLSTLPPSWPSLKGSAVLGVCKLFKV
jgi:hypothetical protein